MAKSSDHNPQHCLDLLLIGKTGHGKSSIGNSIIRSERFSVGYLTSSKTKVPQYEWGTFGDRHIQVVDSPGVFDTIETESQSNFLVHIALQNAMLANPEGYHAFLVVLKFATRFTGEERKTVEILKTILGKNFLKDFGIIVMSNGDTFKHHCGKDGLSIEKFCKDADGHFKHILDECNNRIVVFNNLTQEDELKQKQVKELIDMVDNLGNGGIRYRNEHFVKAGHICQYISKSKKTIVSKSNLKELSLILQGISANENLPRKLDTLKKLTSRISKLITCLKDNDEGSGVLCDLIKNVEDTEKCIRERIKKFSEMLDQAKIIREEEQKINKEYGLKKNMRDRNLREGLEKRKKDLEKRKLDYETKRVDVENTYVISVYNINREHNRLREEAIEQFFDATRDIFKRFGNFVIDSARSIAFAIANLVLPD